MGVGVGVTVGVGVGDDVGVGVGVGLGATPRCAAFSASMSAPLPGYGDLKSAGKSSAAMN